MYTMSAVNKLYLTQILLIHLIIKRSRGIWVVNNLVVHSPQRGRYQWESPVVMRCGTLRVEFNPLNWLFEKFILRHSSPPLEVNLLYASDIQCFLERKHHIFNVYLLDPFFVPPPLDENEEKVPHTTAQEQNNKSDKGQAKGGLEIMENKPPTMSLSNSSFGCDGDDHSPTAAAAVLSSSGSKEEKERAEIVVGEMFKAVQSLGRAVQEGHLPQVWQEQRQRITQGLKEFHVNRQPMTEGLTLVQQISTMVMEKSKQAVKQSNLILQPKRQLPPTKNEVYTRFGRVVLDDLRVFTRNTVVVEEPKQNPSNTKKQEEEHHPPPPPPRWLISDDASLDSTNAIRAALTADEEDLVEMGGVEVARKGTPTGANIARKSHHGRQPSNSSNEIHNATQQKQETTWTSSTGWERDVIIDESTLAPPEAQSSHNPLASDATTPSQSDGSNGTATATKTDKTASRNKGTTTTTTKSYWNKPITVARVAVRASEFGAPLDAKEDDTGFPVLYQPLEKSMDAIFKRVVGDMAKSNTGRLVRTAMGEVLDFYLENEYQEGKKE